MMTIGRADWRVFPHFFFFFFYGAMLLCCTTRERAFAISFAPLFDRHDERDIKIKALSCGRSLTSLSLAHSISNTYSYTVHTHIFFAPKQNSFFDKAIFWGDKHNFFSLSLISFYIFCLAQWGLSLSPFKSHSRQTTTI